MHISRHPLFVPHRPKRARPCHWCAGRPSGRLSPALGSWKCEGSPIGFWTGRQRRLCLRSTLLPLKQSLRYHLPETELPRPIGPRFASIGLGARSWWSTSLCCSVRVPQPMTASCRMPICTGWTGFPKPGLGTRAGSWSRPGSIGKPALEGCNRG